ncbi:hypothetical protein LSTR_LSTR000157 [Laodelphax striatellus]|uniref:RHD domain-containing protein n=1 Tax=Laodelphax striatellus TaxID=195883 RepID=A0A482X6V5_LAOST|nr:hypothetical protein LSTR_LSTR000157 [Laodelphax striatellus]
MSQYNEGMVWNTANTQRWTIYRSPTGSVENNYFANSSSQDSFSSSMSDKVPSPDSTNTLGKPYLKIIEEPANQFRFRYKSEMQGTHGAILGEKATKGEKTFPTVKLFNYEGEAVIRCTLYTAENKRRRPHVHRLVGKLSGRAEKDDPHDLRVGQRVDYTASFQNLVIIHTAKKVLVDELLSKKKRIAEARFARKLSIEKSLLEKMRLEAEQDAKGMNMNSVSLKFEAFSLVNQQYIQICDPVYSQPINNMKSHVTGQLRICRLSRFYSSCEGGDEILLFVEKVGKNNIKLRFTEFDDYGNEIWRDYATHVDVHHQFGISCRCPKYKSQDISREVLVQMQLERPSDGATSEARDFVYKPKEYSNTATKRRRLDSAAFSPQIPDSTSKPQMTTFEPLGPTASCAATSSVVLQSSNTDPLLEIREPFQDKDDFVMLKDTLFSSHVQDEAMHVNTNEENASSSISFSAEIGKIPTPPESMIPSVFSSELQKAFQEEAIAPDYGELVSDSVSTRNLKPPVLLSHLEDLLGDWLSDLNSGVHMSAASASDRGLRVIPNAHWESWSIFDELSSAAEASLRSATASDEQIRFQSDIRPQMESPIYAEAQGFRSPDEDRVRFQMGMPVKREDVLLTLFTAGGEFLQSIVASMQKLISRIQSCNGTHLFAYNAGGPPRKESVEDLFNSIVYLAITDGVAQLQRGVMFVQPMLMALQGLIIPMVKHFLSSSSFKEDGFWNSLFENFPKGFQIMLLNKPLLSYLKNTLRRYELHKSKQFKRSLKRHFWKSVYEDLPEDCREFLLKKIQKLEKQQSTENREKPEKKTSRKKAAKKKASKEKNQDESKKETVSKRSSKVHAKDFAEYSLERLHQIIDTAVLPHVTKSDVEKKILMELETRTAKGDSVLHTAVRYQQFTLLKRLLECIKSHSDDLSPAVNCSNTFNRQTPLHVAVQCNDTDQSRQIVEYLLDLGADPNKSDTSEFTPLHLAVKEKNFHAARCLLEFPGVNINQASADLGTALHIAAEQNSHEMAWLLIQFGADINGIDLQGGQTPLHVAVKKSHVQIVDLLLKQADIDINKEDYRGQTPLQFAILRADTRLMKIVYKLINHGATYESVNIEEGIDDSLESVQEDDTKTMKSKKMQTLAFLFSQISVTENNDSMDDKSEIPQF